MLLFIILNSSLIVPESVWAGNGKKQYKQGQAYEADKKFDQAAEAYLAALGEDENNLEYRIAYQRAATQASVTLVRRGREALEQGQYEEAYNAFRRAYQFDKTNELAKDLASQALNWQRKKEGIAPVPVTETPYGATIPIVLPRNPREGTGDQGSGVRGQPSASSNPQSASPHRLQSEEAPEKDKVRENIIFRNQELEEIIRSLAGRVGLNVVFDSTFRSRKTSFEMRNVTVAQALDTILMSNNLFFEPVNDNTIIIAVDNTANRARLQQMSVQTFYLKSSDEQTVQTIQTSLSALFGQKVMVVPNPQLRSLTVRTTSETLKLVGDIIRALDKDKPEVLIDVSIYEVSRSGMLQIGNQILYDGFFGSGTTSTSAIRPSSLNTLAVTTGQILTEGRFMLSIPTTILRLLQSQGNGRLVDSLQIHALDGQPTTANIGQRIPIQTASLPSSFATVNPNQPNPNPPSPQNTANQFLNSFSLGVPQIEYQNVGLNVKITPTIYSDDDVKLEMEIETSGFTDGPTPLTPIFNQRNLKSVSTIKTGQAAMMAALAQNRQRTSRQGLPLISFLPVLGRFFSIPSHTMDTTDLVITVTPHVIRTADIREEDKLAMSSGLQLIGVSESVESFLERREQARLKRPQAASPTEIAQQQTQDPRPKSQDPNDQRPATSDQQLLAQRLATSKEQPPSETLARAVSGPGTVLAQSLVSENATPVASRTRANNALGEVVSLQLQPSVLQPQTGDSLRVAVFAQSDQPIQRGHVVLRFNPSVLRVRTVTDGSSLSVGGLAVRLETNLVPSGALIVSIEMGEKVSAKLGPVAATSGVLVIVEFEVLGPGESALTVAPEVTKFIKPDGRELSCVSTPVAISAK